MRVYPKLQGRVYIKILFPKVRSALFYIQNPTFFSPERGGRSEAEQQ